MAFIPLKQTVIITPPGIQDEWGNGTPGVPVTVKARVDEVLTVLKVTSQQNPLSGEVISGMKITLDKLADISYDHDIEYTNELGVTIKRKPLKIEPIRMINGKPALTAVYC